MGSLYLVRHGQASFGSQHYDALSALGHQQGHVVGQALKARGVAPEVVVAGTMQRHQETARAALSAMALDRSVQILAGVNEFDHEDVIEVAEPRYADKALMMGEMAASGDPRRAFQSFFQDAVSRWVAGHHDADLRELASTFEFRPLPELQGVPPRPRGEPAAVRRRVQLPAVVVAIPGQLLALAGTVGGELPDFVFAGAVDDGVDGLVVVAEHGLGPAPAHGVERGQ